LVPDTFRLTVRDSRNIILIVGFQAENTLGRRLVKHEEPIRIFGEEHELEAEVHSIQALTAHADRNEMLKYFRDMGPQVDHAFIVHGELEQNQAMADALTEIGARNVVIPGQGHAIDL